MPRPFHDLQHELFRLYGLRRYQEALDLVRSGLTEHPEYRSRITFWAVCLECRLERPEAALQTLGGLVSEGGWVSPLRLRQDDDLTPLRSRPEFEELVAVCEERRARQQEQVIPQLSVEEPRRAVKGEPPLLLAMHMMGGNIEETRQHWLPVTGMGLLLAMPQGTELVGPHEFGWGAQTDDEIGQHLDTLGRNYAFDPERTIYGGASRGAAVAVQLAVSRRHLPSRGFIAIVGAPQVETLEPHLGSAAEADVRGVFISGDQDFALERVQAAHDLLEGAGLEVRLEVIPGLGHAYPEDLPLRLHESVEFVLGKTLPLPS